MRVRVKILARERLKKMEVNIEKMEMDVSIKVVMKKRQERDSS